MAPRPPSNSVNSHMTILGSFDHAKDSYEVFNTHLSTVTASTTFNSHSLPSVLLRIARCFFIRHPFERLLMLLHLCNIFPPSLRITTINTPAIPPSPWRVAFSKILLWMIVMMRGTSQTANEYAYHLHQECTLTSVAKPPLCRRV